MGIRTNVGEIKFRDADGTFQPLPIVSGTVSGGISEEDLKKIHKEITQEEYDNLVNANQVEDDVVYFIKDSYDSTADEEIPAGADLNDYTTPGIYLVTSSENASEIANLPVQAMGFLVVKRTNSTSALQTYHVAYSHGQMIHDTSRGAEWRRRYDSTAASMGDEWSIWACTSGVNSIVTEGDSGIWHYRMWANGVAECWGRVVKNDSVSTTWGTAYISSQIVIGNYPFNFTTTPNLHITVDGQNTSYSGIAATVGCSSASSAGNVYVMRPNKDDTVRAWGVNAYAIGRWK